MADIRINSLPSTATSFNTDDYIAIDGASGGTRKMLAATLPLTDVTLGASGPSVKSTLSARAPRQGLVFDGSGGNGTFTAVPIGSGNFSVSALVNLTSYLATGRIISRGSAWEFGVYSDGRIYVYNGTTVLFSTSLAPIGKACLISYTKSGSSGTFYLNGISAGTVTDNNTYTSASEIGGNAANNAWLGTIQSFLIYNRALSASEVVSLYESGAPAGADYNSASNTLLNTSTALNAYSTSFTTFTGASATGFTASDSTASKSPRVIFPLSGTLVAGRRYRAKFTATLTAMSSVNLWQSDSSYAGLANLGAVSSGSNEFTFTATSSVNAMMLLCTTDGSVGTHSVVISGLSVDTPGLLLAPDAAQAGGGLVWYDTSGNAANITLPASGVSWNVPTSGYVTSGSSLNLSAGGTNQNITLTPSGTGVTVFNRAASAGNAFQWTNGTVSGSIYLQSTGTPAGAALGTTSNHPLYFFTNSSAAQAVLATTGNLLIGTTTDGGQKLQVAGTIKTTTGVEVGNGFGVTGTNGSVGVFPNGNQLTAKSFSDMLFQVHDGSAYTTQLTLGSGASPNATFAGSITSSAFPSLTIAGGNISAQQYISLNTSGNNGVNIANSTTFTSLVNGSSVLAAIPTLNGSGSGVHGVIKVAPTLTAWTNTGTFVGLDLSLPAISGTVIGLRSNKQVSVTDTTASTSTTTGALVVSGGVGVAGAVNVGGDATFAGSIRQNQANNISLTSGVATTIFSLGTSAAVYIVTATLDVNGNSGYAIVGKGATGNWQVLANSGSQISFSMSTNDLQITQSSGSTSTTNTFNLLRLR